MIKHKRNKTAIALLLPVIALVFLLGWLMYWIGDGTESQVKKKYGVEVVFAKPMEVPA